jgi:ubiquinone/menaquinone biosynthesis C-methylase UbiE
MSTTDEADPWVPVWDGDSYAANTGHHRVHDAWFLEQFPVQPADRLLDLGCGSGDFTRTVADLVPEGSVLGVDAQPSMLAAAARVQGPNQSFVLAPVQRLDDVDELRSPEHDGSFDAVFSRSVLHWVPRTDLPAVLASAFRLVRPGGFLRIECGGAGNVPAVVATFDRVAADFGGTGSPWHFADAGATLDALERAGFELGTDGYVRTVAQRRAFDRESFAGWVESQAIEAYLTSIAPERHDAFRAAIAENLDGCRRHDGTFDQTYVRLDLLVRKPA